MEWKLLSALLILSIAGENRRSFVDTAPLKDDLKSNDETVKELENLKGFIGVGESPAKDEVSVTKSRVSFFVDDNGKKTGQLKLKNEVDKNGKVVAKVQEEVGVVNNKGEPPQSMTKTEIEIPSKGIHDFFVKTGPRAKGSQGKTVDRQNEVEKNNFSGGIGYGPLDMAEYIYWTGDEKNVALMIEQFLQKGLISRQEAINFLQSIKLNLDFMEARDKNLQKFDKKSLLNVAKSSSYELPMSPVNYEKTDQEYNKLRNSIAFDPKPSKSAFKASSGSNDNEEAMERLRLADQLYKEYSLEEIIYQLAKVMFTQSLGKGNTEAQNALHKLVTFFQKEVKNGQVSRNLERKLLVVLFAALTDTLSEQTESMFSERESLLNNIGSYSLGAGVMSELEDGANVKGDLQKKNDIKSTAESFKKLE